MARRIQLLEGAAFDRAHLPRHGKMGSSSELIRSLGPRRGLQRVPRRITLPTDHAHWSVDPHPARVAKPRHCNRRQSHMSEGHVKVQAF